MAESTSTTRCTTQKDTAIFTYGTLKRGFPNHHLLQDLISTNDATFISSCVTTVHPYPLVVGPNGIPFLINIPGQGQRVKGELYRVSARGMVIVDELEGTNTGHYDRLPLRVEIGGESEEAEAYFADCGFGERMWRKIGEGLSEYGEKDSEVYVRKEDRPAGTTFVGEIQFVFY
ncbi:Putative gamma-glutamylcyclotransferase At3g02910 [Linum grandiflorum]